MSSVAGGGSYVLPEGRARMRIDEMLEAAGWAVQDARAANLAASRGVAVREFVMKRPHGRADYLLFLDGRAAGVVEAKKEGQTLTGVEHQTAKYVDGLPDELEPAVEGGLAFAYESTGTETRFTNRLDPEPASRPVYSFHRPETLAGWLEELRRHPEAPTLRHRLRELPELSKTGLWPAQFRAISNLEQSLAANRRRALIQMATGSGKTFTAANVCYRLVKHADARRILFLVDRANLGRQTLKEFQGFTTPDDGRKFTELYKPSGGEGRALRGAEEGGAVVADRGKEGVHRNGESFLGPADREEASDPLNTVDHLGWVRTSSRGRFKHRPEFSDDGAVTRFRGDDPGVMADIPCRWDEGGQLVNSNLAPDFVEEPAPIKLVRQCDRIDRIAALVHLHRDAEDRPM